VRFGMEDTLRFLVEGSIAKFVAFMQVGHAETSCACSTAGPAQQPLWGLDDSSLYGVMPGCLHTCNTCLPWTAAPCHTGLLQRLCERQHVDRPGGGTAARCGPQGSPAAH
jgi:hypothetical protein